METYGLQIQSRPYARLGLSDLITGKKLNNSDIKLLKEKIDLCLCKYELRSNFLDISHGLQQIHPQFSELPALFSFSKGSLPSIMVQSGITNMSSSQPTEFNENIQKEMIEKFIKELSTNPYKTAILYYKDPDWASHFNDAKLKIASLEAFDRLLSFLIKKISYFQQITILSDHLSNIGSPAPTDAPSPFWIYRSEYTQKKSARFDERFANEHRSYPHPLSMLELHKEIF